MAALKTSKIRYPWRWVLAAGVVALMGLGAIAIATGGNRGPAYDVNALTVPVDSTALTVRIQASGTVEPIQTVNLSPRTAGILERLYVEQGDTVVAGQLIAQMRSSDIEAQLRQSRAAVAEAEARLAEVQRGNVPAAIGQGRAAVAGAVAQAQDAQARLDLAQGQLERNRQLQAQGAISANELDTFVREVRSAEAGLVQAQARTEETRQRLLELGNAPEPEAVAQAAARLEQSLAQLQAAEVSLEDTRIRAPFAGVITQKFATAGAFVTPTTSASEATSATSTAIVALASGLEILAEVPEADISQIRPGQAVEIQANAFPDDIFQGQVRLIAPEAIVRQNVTLFQVRINLLTGTDRLLSNLNVNVSFIGDSLQDALVVPTVAVITQAGRTGVLVPDERDRVRFRPVTLGSQAGENIQILEGVTVGERVFVDLPPGQTLDSIQPEN
ncbi:efflux RND transporter periplasmic adaptor subunit [Leptolyngbya sp. PCC 6406]|uniref:efflux RND transporter periplasmic adaptor subunit n=1 Tax=Leptolyngbya sp. PCC 6406 TaxID=1173264 RepID=UPI0002ACC3BA|nr:efflux RND transporter periplasmic adaptor subunit [Leptolyngbya sp. PCC 6406]